MTIRNSKMPPHRQLLARILEMPNLTQAVRSLEPGALHRLIRKCGLEDSGAIIALATTEQLLRIFDDDLWRSEKAGAEERFDADRFGLWIEVLAEMGGMVAAEKLASMDFDFVTAAVAQHILVLDSEWMMLDPAAFSDRDEYDPLEGVRASLTEKVLEGSLSHEFSGYTAVSRRSESWDAMLLVLLCLEDAYHDFFHRLMARCARLATEYIDGNGGLYEVLTESEQVMDDVAAERERRRESEGYISPADAAAFLKHSRQLRTDPRAPLDAVMDRVAASYLRSPKPRAGAGIGQQGMKTSENQSAALLTILRESDVIPRSHVPLPAKGAAFGQDRLSRVRTLLERARSLGSEVFSVRMTELGFLANALIAGCSFQARRFRPVEAADAALAACNLGLELWPEHWSCEKQSLITAFKVGWSVVHKRVSLYVAQRLAEILAELHCDDAELGEDLADLSARLKFQINAGTPWKERDNLDAIAILDQPSWATLLGLLDECPVVPRLNETHESVGKAARISSAFEFIAESCQILWIEKFINDLPARLVS